MIRNYLKLALRNLLKRKVYSLINIVGLSVGFAVCLVIWKYVDFELGYDKFHSHGASIYRATFTEYGKNLHDDWFENFGFGLGPALEEEIPEIRNFVRIHPLYGDRALISHQNEFGEHTVFAEDHVLFADSTFFSVFTFQLLSGHASTALDHPGSVVLTVAMAEKYFGKGTDPIGKTLHVSTLDWGRSDYTVTGVMEDVPENSSLQFNFLLSMHDLLQIEYYKEKNADWSALNFVTYVQMHEGVDPKAMEGKIKSFMDRHTGTEPAGVKLSFQPLRQINLSPDLNAKEGHLTELYFLLLISAFVLLIAIINFVNLSTARATERAKEVGIRKAIGVNRRELMMQFMVESVTLNFVSVGMALILSLALMPVLSALTGKWIPIDFSDPKLWLLLSALFALGSLVSGFYPAFILSSFKTAEVLKDRINTVGSGLWLRRILVMFQFSASLLLIFSTFLMYRQMKYMQERDKGLNMHKMLVVNGPQILHEEGHAVRMSAFKNDLRTLSFVRDVATSGKIPGSGFNFTAGLQVAGREREGEFREPIRVVWVDTDFIKTYGMKLLSGQTWDPKSDYQMSVIVNEAAIEKFSLGTPEQALEERIRINGSDPFAIQAVVRNFHWNSLRTPYEPMLFRPQEVNYNLFSIHLSGENQGAVVQIEKLFKKHFPGDPFVYKFLEDFFNSQYKEERLFERLFGIFSALAIVIACLGLLGLAAFTTTQRKKEIGIRKVMGATVRNIIGLLSSQFVRLFVFASLVSVPLAWYASRRWLDNFAFRIDLTMDLYLLPVLTLSAICMVTISLVILRGARMNAAEVLRSE